MKTLKDRYQKNMLKMMDTAKGLGSAVKEVGKAAGRIVSEPFTNRYLNSRIKNIKDTRKEEEEMSKLRMRDHNEKYRIK